MNKFNQQIEIDAFTTDSDDSMEARKFYIEYWPKDLLKSDFGLLRGETIISFNTIAGCMIRMLDIYNNKDFTMPSTSEKRLKIIIDNPQVEDEVKKAFNDFYLLYHTLANFMPLIKPNKWYNNLQFIKSQYYHEFPDRFFDAIRAYYLDTEEINKKFTQDDNNINYLDYFGVKETGWKNFVKVNYLQDFFEDNSDKTLYGNIKRLSPENDIYSKMPYTGKKALSLNDNYKIKCIAAIKEFLDKAIDIINNRAKRLNDVKI